MTGPLFDHRWLIQQFLPVHEINVTPLGGGFSGATVLRVDCAGGSFVLRCWPAMGPDERRLSELHQYLTFLAHQGIPVAVPYPVWQGEAIWVKVQGAYWQLEPLLAGMATGEEQISDAELANAMRAIGRFHIVSSGYSAGRKGREFETAFGCPPAVTFRRRLIADWTRSRLEQVTQSLRTAPGEFAQLGHQLLKGFQRCALRVDRELAQCESQRVPLHPCWRDLWSAHVLFVDHQVTGIIDAGSAKTDHISSDLSRFLGSVLAEDHDRWEQALSIYNEIRPILDAERLLIRTMDRSSVLLSGMTWMERWACGQLWADEITDSVLARLRRFQSRLAQIDQRTRPILD